MHQTNSAHASRQLCKLADVFHCREIQETGTIDLQGFHVLSMHEGGTICLFDVWLGVVMERSIEAISVGGKDGEGWLYIKRSSKLGTLY